MVLACDGTPVTVACPEENGFKITPSQLEAAITPRTRWLLINSPSNPTGASYTLAEYRALADVLAAHPHVLVMTDDIYEHLRYDGQSTPHFLQAAPELRDRTLTINGVSKTYAMTGWRIGYVAGPRDLIVALDTLLSQSSGNCCSISQAAATAALNGDQSFVTESTAIYKKRRDVTLEMINAIPGLSCRQPDGAFYLYINCAALLGKSTPEGKLDCQRHRRGDVSARQRRRSCRRRRGLWPVPLLPPFDRDVARCPRGRLPPYRHAAAKALRLSDGSRNHSTASSIEPCPFIKLSARIPPPARPMPRSSRHCTTFRCRR